MIKPTPEQYGLTESLLVSLERERGKFDALEAHIGRLVVITIATGAISAIAVYSVYGFDWPIFVPMLLIGAVIMGYLSPMLTAVTISRLDPHSRIHKLRSEYQVVLTFPRLLHQR
jgi:Na+/glutamate symporter